MQSSIKKKNGYIKGVGQQIREIMGREGACGRSYCTGRGREESASWLRENETVKERERKEECMFSTKLHHESQLGFNPGPL